ncbi:MAG: DNA sulfur modification protein DndD, partial [Sphaerospermopsis sp. SIO1G2]|nr:DNA sulfur modification protein DndD [Sphaerospermopsis sp. SIO1G2]
HLLPQKVVVDAINALLGLELADKLAIDLEILVNRKKKENADTQDLAKLAEIEAKLSEQLDKRNVIKKEQDYLKDILAELELKHEEAVHKYMAEGGKIAAESSKLDTQKETQIKNIENVRQDLRELAEGVLPLALIPNLLSQIQIQSEKEFKLQQVQLAKDVLIARDERLISLLNQLDLELAKINKIQTFLTEDIDSLYAGNSSSEITWLNADEESLSLLDNLVYRLQTTQNHTNQKLRELQNYEEEILRIERQIQTAAAPEEYAKLKKAREKSQAELTKAASKFEVINRSLTELEATINQTKKELNNYTSDNLKYHSNEHLINAATKVQQTLQIFREKLTLRKLNKLEEEVKNCFLYLLHKSDLVHRIAIDEKNFSLSLYDLNGKQVPKHRLSAGEKQLLAIAFLWGLAKVSGKRLPIAIDTPLGRLDSSHRNNLVERYFPAASHQVILLSTDTEISKPEHQTLKENGAIAREYLLEYNSKQRETSIKEGYFW